MTAPKIEHMLRDGGGAPDTCSMVPTVASFHARPIGAGEGFFSAMQLLTLRFNKNRSTSVNNLSQPLVDDGEFQGPSQVVAKFAVPYGVRLNILTRALGFNRTEVNFYKNKAMIAPDLPTPKCYFAHYDPTHARIALLLEVVNGKSCDLVTGIAPDVALAAVVQLARFHANNWNRIRLKGIGSFATLRSDTNFRNFARDRVFRPGVAGLPTMAAGLRSSIDPEIQEYLGSVARHFNDINSLFFTPREIGGRFANTLIHGDFRAENIMVPEELGQPVVQDMKIIDFQLVKEGSGELDLCYMLAQSLAPAVRAEHEKTLMLAYHTELNRSLKAQGQPHYPISEFIFCYQLVHYQTAAGFLTAESRRRRLLYGTDEESEKGRMVWRCMFERFSSSAQEWGAKAALEHALSSPSRDIDPKKLAGCLPREKARLFEAELNGDYEEAQ